MFCTPVRQRWGWGLFGGWSELVAVLDGEDACFAHRLVNGLQGFISEVGARLRFGFWGQGPRIKVRIKVRMDKSNVFKTQVCTP